ncbi:MAG: HlyD family efflux transporter periplasmic adaptor subunit [Acidobacteria bacterium]|nr:HlyD family efflux transporter periplasmic adaptor subunit [Acidobacteriota bacterium]MBU1475005.1 HlyD family efflux transporter periplasmic adaptor subunit [Acidobacteriota bacterium]
MKKLLWIGPLVLLILASCAREDKSEAAAQGLVEGDVLTMKALVPGTVVEVLMEEGGRVSQGDVLLRLDVNKLDNQLVELDIARRELTVKSRTLRNKQKWMDANIDYLKKQVERFRRLKDKQSIAGEQLDTLELKLLEAETGRYELLRSLESLRIQAEQLDNKNHLLQLQMKDYTLLSPVSGIVLEKFISPGENVFPGIPVADILDENSLHIEMFIEGEELTGLVLNQKVRLRPDGVDRAISGTVIQFGQKAEFSPKYIISEKERKSLLYMVKVRIDEERDLFKIGMPVTVLF